MAQITVGLDEQMWKGLQKYSSNQTQEALMQYAIRRQWQYQTFKARARQARQDGSYERLELDLIFGSSDSLAPALKQGPWPHEINITLDDETDRMLEELTKMYGNLLPSKETAARYALSRTIHSEDFKEKLRSERTSCNGLNERILGPASPETKMAFEQFRKYRFSKA